MKKLLPAFTFLALSSSVALCLRASAPAQGAHATPAKQAQATPSTTPAQGLEARVATLESELAAEKKRHEETRMLLDQSIAYLDKQAKAAQALLAVLDESEQQGFAVGENWGSRVTLLAGFRAYWGGQQTGLPKLPPPPPAKPAEPWRRPRQE